MRRIFRAGPAASRWPCIVMPIVVRTTDETMLRLIPDTLREAAIALGAPKWKVITQVMLPRGAAPASLTGVLLAIARIAAKPRRCCSRRWTTNTGRSNLAQPMASLPVTIFQYRA